LSSITETSSIQRGILKLKDGTLLRFAFLSHHVADDHESHTVFKSNGYARYMKGYFCCEVEFGSLKQPDNITEFDKLIRELDGQSP
jgi:hypothetical protein